MTIKGLYLGAFCQLIVGVLILSLSIVEENRLEGYKNWWYESGSEATGPEGFASNFSVQPGYIMQFRIKSVEKEVRFRIFRIGYYQGLGARLIDSAILTNSDSFNQPKCYLDLRWKLVDCSNWRENYSWRVPLNATTGVYVALPTTHRHYPNGSQYTQPGMYIPFIVRQPQGRMGSDLLFKTSDTTWVAYNKYGNWNLYRGNGTFDFPSRAYKVSYNRPFSNRLPRLQGGQHQNFLFGSEFPLIFWLERLGYSVSYCSSQDVELLHRQSLLRPAIYRAVLSVGHDEYYTGGMRRALEAAREQGVHLAFFSGNEIFWRVRGQHLLDAQPVAEDLSHLYSEWSPHTKYLPTHLELETAATVGPWRGEARVLECFKETIDGGRPVDKLAHLSSSYADYSVSDRNSHVLQPSPAASEVSPKLVYEMNRHLRRSSSSAEDQWTGTFVDPRHRCADPQSGLTGQSFGVNGPRADVLSVPADYSHLRLWRHTSFYNSSSDGNSTAVHRTFAGVLGYEVNIWVDDCFRPHGLVSLSDSLLSVQGMLVEDYGARYKGSGEVRHRLTLYRYHARMQHQLPPYPLLQVNNSVQESGALKKSRQPAYSLQSLTRYMGRPGKRPKSSARPPTTALVFAAGTIQWSWALSRWHDADKPIPPVDYALQQATLNLLADMGARPLGTVHTPLVLPAYKHVATVLRPQSTITFPRSSGTLSLLLQRDSFIEVHGEAVAIAPAVIGAVEVSLDLGLSWHSAIGRERWTHRHYLFDSARTKQCRPPSPTPASGDVFRLVILSRAVDDSGWIEENDFDAAEHMLAGSSVRRRAGRQKLANMVAVTVQVLPL